MPSRPSTSFCSRACSGRAHEGEVVATSQRGGILVRTFAGAPPAPPDTLVFIPAEMARRVTALSAVTPVAGVRAPAVGIAIADGEVVTVLRIGTVLDTPADPPPRNASPRR